MALTEAKMISRRNVLQGLGAIAVETPLSAFAQGRCMRTFGTPACNTTPIAENDGHGFESFHVKDPDGFDLQISNVSGLTKSRRTTPAIAKLSTSAPFEPTGWRTVWLDHLSFGATNYKRSVSFYGNLLG